MHTSQKSAKVCPQAKCARVPFRDACLVSRDAVGLLEGFNSTSVHFKSGINDAFPRKRCLKQHLDFCATYLLSTMAQVRVLHYGIALLCLAFARHHCFGAAGQLTAR